MDILEVLYHLLRNYINVTFPIFLAQFLDFFQEPLILVPSRFHLPNEIEQLGDFVLDLSPDHDFPEALLGEVGADELLERGDRLGGDPEEDFYLVLFAHFVQEATDHLLVLQIAITMLALKHDEQPEGWFQVALMVKALDVGSLSFQILQSLRWHRFNDLVIVLRIFLE